MMIDDDNNNIKLQLQKKSLIICRG